MDREQLGFYAEKYGKAVFRAAYSYTRNFADSEDIMQASIVLLCSETFSAKKRRI